MESIIPSIFNPCWNGVVSGKFAREEPAASLSDFYYKPRIDDYFYSHFVEENDDVSFSSSFQAEDLQDLESFFI